MVLVIPYRKYKKKIFSENIRKLRFLKLFFWENIRHFFRGGVFKKKFWRLGPKSVLGSPLIYYVNLIREKDGTYPFMIVNTDKSGAHWWSISWTWIQSWKSFCLRALVWRDLKGLSQETIKKINKTLFGTGKFKESDKTRSFVATKFSTSNCKRLKDRISSSKLNRQI